MWEVRILTKPTLKYLPTGLMAHAEIRNHLVNSNANLRLLLLSWLPGNTSINQLLSGLQVLRWVLYMGSLGISCRVLSILLKSVFWFKQHAVPFLNNCQFIFPSTLDCKEDCIHKCSSSFLLNTDFLAFTMTLLLL